jgi:DNA-binding Xre family transcriptional regulator
VITNERQYRITKAEAERFAEALATSDESISELDPRLRRAMREGLASQLAELREDLAAYEALRGGHVSVIELDSLGGLPDALIRARIASGLSQKLLAARLGVKEQQIQRWEAARYASVTLDRLQRVADALGVKIREQIVLPSKEQP